MDRQMTRMTSARLAGRFRPTVEGLEGRALLSGIGVPDPNFADRGEYIVPVKVSGDTGLVNIYAMDVQPDGKIDVGGLSGFSSSRTFGVVRLNANGTLDTAFGQDGEA